MSQSIAIEFSNETASKVSPRIFEQHGALVLRRLGQVGRVKIELALVGDTTIQDLNKRFLQHDYPTDVLSFPNDAPSEASDSTIGSLAISVDTAATQAKQAGISLEKELKTLFSHGLLHLLGYHHQ